MDEEPLPTNASNGVVRVGDTVRRPVTPGTAAIDQLLLHLESVGFDGAPRALGRDDEGRQVLEFVEGEPGSAAPDYSTGELRAIGTLLRDLHDAVGGFTPASDTQWNQVVAPDGTDLICHGDAAPWNVVRGARRWVLIDWDHAGPATRLWELAYAFQTAAIPSPHKDIAAATRDLRCMVDAYGLDDAQRVLLVDLLAVRTDAMQDLLRRGHDTGEQPWARIWLEDGAHWTDMTRFLRRHRSTWLAALH